MKAKRKFWIALIFFVTSSLLCFFGKIPGDIWSNVALYTLLFFMPANVAEHLIDSKQTPWANGKHISSSEA